MYSLRPGKYQTNNKNIAAHPLSLSKSSGNGIKQEKSMNSYSAILAINHEGYGFIVQWVKPETWMLQAHRDNLDLLNEDPFIGYRPGLYYVDMKETRTAVTWEIKKPIIRTTSQLEERAYYIAESMKTGKPILINKREN